MVEKLATRVIRNTAELFELTNKCAQAAEARERQIDSRSRLTSDRPASSKGANRKDKKSKRKAGPPEVLAVEQAGLTRRCFEEKGGKKGRGYCLIHRTDVHDLTECKVVRGIFDQELGESKC